jgi:predicted RNA-binding Zn ribbon-like protein
LRVTCQESIIGYVMEMDTVPQWHPEGHVWESHGQARHGHQASLEDALDFVNTLYYTKAVAQERLPDVATAVPWLQRHELLHRGMVDDLLARYADDPEGSARLMARIRRTRAALRELLDATIEHRPPTNRALREINRALRFQYVYELVPAADGVSLDHRHEGDPINGALARLSEAVARELTQGDPSRLRICANDECRWVFRDYSPAGRRKWCDMSSCGNRAKAARHRARVKGETEAVAPGPAELAETPGPSGLA